jgi:SAM-dependent methyltransferase
MDPADTWAAGEAYERYMGRWSRLVAREFVDWLALPENLNWLDAGCGVGALTQELLARVAPAMVTGLDSSEGFLAYARERAPDRNVAFHHGDAQRLPFADRSFDVAVSGLVLNFIPSPERAVSEMRRIVRPGGVTAAYVWDYAGEMQLIRRFWDAAVALDPAAEPLHEARRFPICRPEALLALFRGSGLESVQCRTLVVETVFENFDDYWSPFLGGQGPAPSYVKTLTATARDALRERLRATLPAEPDGAIRLSARAFALRAVRGA